MSISIDEVNRIAKLARLSFDDTGKQKLQKELSDILNYVDQLKEVAGKSSDLVVDESALNLMRNDVVEMSSDPEEFLSQAPGREGKYIKVKSVLD